jgi:hypothetical protein|tara:strand:- start:171 stop:362 length:192 start_codon:yes stop_codon:yes gene_type:complete
MLTNAFYERILGTIGENDLNMLSDSEAAELMKQYKKLLSRKKGDLTEITYDDIIDIWDDRKRN